MQTLESCCIKHQAKENGWIPADKVINPRVLILGSFNPSNPEVKPLIYYYGRERNRFWKAVGLILNNDKNFYLNNMSLMKQAMDDRFCFFDVIESLTISGEKSLEFVKEVIYKEFNDQQIFKTKDRKRKLLIKRSYNQDIISFLENSKSVKTIINTLGKGKGDFFSFNSRDEQWSKFRKQLKDVCDKKGINLVDESKSPSAHSGLSTEEFAQWLKSYIL